MKFQPLITSWQILVYTLVAIAASGWLIWRVRKKGRKIIVRWLRRVALLLLPALIALGPSIAGGTSAPGVSNLDVIFAVDTTPSMGAQDYNGTHLRLDGVKSDLLLLADKLQGAHLEIISFDSNANIILPLTTDTSAFSAAVQGMTPEVSTYSQGSAIDRPIDVITQELNASKASYPYRSRLVFYLGDGEQTAGTPVKSFASIAPLINGGAVLGYGTTTGAKMYNYTSASTSGTALKYIMTISPATNQLVPAISTMDPTALQAIASQLKVTYQNRDKGGSISSTFQNSKSQLAIDHSQHIVHYLNLYWLFAIPLAGLFFWEWQALMINLLDLRKQHGGKHA